jgi:hypothetical protein
MRHVMSCAPPSTPTQRLDRLEREARWWRVLALMSAALLGVLLLLGAAPPGAPVQDEIRARIVTLVDAAGHTRAAWFVGHDGEVNLSFFDRGPSPGQTGLSRVHLWLGAAGAGLSLSDKAKGPQAALSVVTGTPTVTLRGDDGRPRVLLALTPEHGGSLNFYDKTGPNVGAFTENTITLHAADSASRIALSRTSRGALLDLAGDGKSRVTLGMLNLAPALEFHDGDGRRRAMLAVSTDGQPVFGLTDQNGTPRVGMTVLPSGRPQIMP